ncbi:unnamed protein product [Acanthoscelides obtectus]|uniref:AMP-dependent synthetase/ligase domain-containing protein n=1 Tax=Acanthoscelides obtectus TaxID=200917 RepID=A0A9P0M043_ACAOB|nr:unnamed protein product [Acanthoscelides obtectus]CAK1621536.1 4-coumarate--CoA ligase 3 [Acanthoscelides obtectus]
MGFWRVILSRKPTRVLKQALSGLRELSQAVAHPNILYSDREDVEVPRIPVHQYIYAKIEPFHKYTFTECSVTGRKYTYEEVRVKARNLSKSIVKKLRLQKDDVVAIFLPNIPEYPICCLGIMEAGLAVTTMNPIYTAEEISKQILDSNAKAMITLNQNNLTSTAEAAIKMAKRTLPIIVIKDKECDDLCRSCIDFGELVDTNTDIPDFDHEGLDRMAFLPYSSGTTGLPKGVELTHNNLVSNLCQGAHQDFNKFVSANGNFQEVIPAVLPMFHIYGFMVNLLNVATYGTKVVTIPRFHPELYISVLKQHAITAIYAAPPLVLFMIQHPDVRPEYMKNVKFILSAAAPLGSLDEQHFQEKFGVTISITQGYGLTETSPLVTLFPKKYAEETSQPVTGSIGKLLPNTRAKVISLDDPTGTLDRALNLKRRLRTIQTTKS